MKLFKALLISSLATYIISLVIFFIMGIGNDLMLPLILSTAIFSPIVIIGALVFWGIPCHLCLKKLGSNSPFFYALAGFIPIPICLALLTPFGKEQLIGFLVQCAIFGSISIVAACVLWYSLVYKES